MAATLTATLQRIILGNVDPLTVHTWAWVSHTDGSVASLPVYVPPGRIDYLKVLPASGGTQPTNLFDLTLVDSDGLDLLAIAGGGSRGADLSNAAPTLIQWDPPILWKGGNLTPTVANAGSGKAGTFELGVR